MKKFKILVTAAGGASGLYTIKLLKEDKNTTIVAVDPDKHAVGLFLADARYTIPKAGNSLFISRIIDIVQRENIDAILPNISDELPIFAKNISQIPCKVVLSPLKTITICHDKSKTYKYFQEIVSVPRSFIYGNIKDSDFPLFVKPKISRGSNYTYKVMNKKHLDTIISLLEFGGYGKDDLIITEYIPGREYTVDVLFNLAGKYIVSAARVRLLTQSGVSVTARVIKSSVIDTFIQHIVSHLTFYGPINIQLKETQEGGLKLLEINPRLSGGISLTAKAGLNIPILLLRLLRNEPISERLLEYKELTVGRFYKEIVMQ